MTGAFDVRYTDSARNDLLRLFDFLIERARTIDDLDDAQRAIDIIRTSIEGQLAATPLIYRKVGTSPFIRELVIPFRSTGYVALYEVPDGACVNVLAVRHQLEDDYY